MMGKTHLAIGMAAALAVSIGKEPGICAIALSCGAVGGVIADVDALRHDYKHDALIGELLSVLVVALSLCFDYYLEWGILKSIIQNGYKSLIGCVVFVILWIIGLFSKHRSFTHSLTALVLYSCCFLPINIFMAFYFSIGYLTHLLLDLLNKKKLPLLYPMKKGLCFNLCYASKLANAIFMWIGFVSSLVLLGIDFFIR